MSNRAPNCHCASFQSSHWSSLLSTSARVPYFAAVKRVYESLRGDLDLARTCVYESLRIDLD